MILESGTIIEEISDGQVDIRCLVLEYEKHPTVRDLGTYVLYVIYSGNTYALPGETMVVRSTLVESTHANYHWRII